jgi:hypothetical protein
MRRCKCSEELTSLRLEVAELRLLVERLRPAASLAVSVLPMFRQPGELERSSILATEAVPFP